MSSTALSKQDGPVEQHLKTEIIVVIFAAYVVLAGIGSALVGSAWFAGFASRHGIKQIDALFLLGLTRDVVTLCMAAGIDGGYWRSLRWNLSRMDLVYSPLCGVALGYLVSRLYGAPLSPTKMSVIGIVAVCMVGPVVEEIVFRAYLLNWLFTRISSKVAAVLIGSMVFAAFHQNFLYVLITGIAYSLIYITREKRIIAPILAHAAYNTTVLILFR